MGLMALGNVRLVVTKESVYSRLTTPDLRLTTPDFRLFSRDIRAHSRDRPRVELPDARLRDVQHLADLTQR